MNIIEHNLQFGTLTKRRSTERVVIHHAACNGSVEDIHRIHKSFGWAGIGYHIYIRKDGSVHRGRPIWAIGAHASGANYNSIGICCEGNFETETMPEVQKQAVKDVVARLRSEYGIKIFQKHSDVCRTACPGKNFPFNEIVNAGVSVTIPDVPAAKPVPNTDGTKAVVKAGQIHANNFCGAKLDPDGKRGSATKMGGIKVLQTAINLDYNANINVDGYFETKSKAALGKHYVRRGETQYLVTAVEILLMIKGYACEVQCPGSFDENLERIVRQYQRDYQLTEDGIVGYSTLMSLIH